MKTRTKLLISLSALLVAGAVNAEPRSVPVDIVNMRPYTDGSYFVTVSSNAMLPCAANAVNCIPAATCTTVYKVKSDDPGAKAVIASLLTAYALPKQIQIEVPTITGCTNWGTNIASVFLQ